MLCCQINRICRILSHFIALLLIVSSCPVRAFAEDKEKAAAAGMNGHLAKPINVTELMKALAEILG